MVACIHGSWRSWRHGATQAVRTGRRPGAGPAAARAARRARRVATASAFHPVAARGGQAYSHSGLRCGREKRRGLRCGRPRRMVRSVGPARHQFHFASSAAHADGRRRPAYRPRAPSRGRRPEGAVQRAVRSRRRLRWRNQRATGPSARMAADRCPINTLLTKFLCTFGNPALEAGRRGESGAFTTLGQGRSRAPAPVKTTRDENEWLSPPGRRCGSSVAA
jgi:hypothetical protein